MQARASNPITSFLKSWFGDFQRDELIKFLKLGVIFAFVIGVYWTMRPLKDSIFASMVHARNQPWAKLASLVVLFPLVAIYSKLVDKVARHHMFYILGTIYCIGTVILGLLFLHPTIGLANTTVDASRIIAWVWYVFVESYGSLVVALFWAFAASMVSPDSAKRGFPIVIMIGQLGSICGPYFLTPLGQQVFGNSGPTVLICGGLIAIMMLLVYIFMATTPRSQMRGYHGDEPEKGEGKSEAHTEPGFFEGLQIMLRQPYLLGIFAVIGFFEIITTIIDYNFKYLVYNSFATEALRSAYLGNYAVYVNLIAFFSLLLGVSNIQRRVGIKASLLLMPVIVAGMVLSFWVWPVVQVVFWIMVVAKAMNYALNGPALKQLYVPTTKDVKFKAQAWIETFGSRGSKGAGSGFNLLQTPFEAQWGVALGAYYLVTAGAIMSFGFIFAWFFIARFLGKKYEHAVAKNEVVC